MCGSSRHPPNWKQETNSNDVGLEPSYICPSARRWKLMQVDAVELNTGGKPLRMRIDKPLGQFETVRCQIRTRIQETLVFLRCQKFVQTCELYVVLM